MCFPTEIVVTILCGNRLSSDLNSCSSYSTFFTSHHTSESISRGCSDLNTLLIDPFLPLFASCSPHWSWLFTFKTCSNERHKKKENKTLVYFLSLPGHKIWFPLWSCLIDVSVQTCEQAAHLYLLSASSEINHLTLWSLRVWTYE